MALTSLKHKELIVGKTYHVQLEDCCIVGEFTAEFLELIVDEDDSLSQQERLDYAGTKWSNGVELTTDTQVYYQEVP